MLSALSDHAHVSQAGLIACGLGDGFEAERFIEPDGGSVPRSDIQLKASKSSTLPGSHTHLRWSPGGEHGEAESGVRARNDTRWSPGPRV